MVDFTKEVQSMSTSDIMLILEDQLDLYTEEEIAILRSELHSRPGNALELEEREQERLLEIRVQEESDEQERNRMEAEEAQRKEWERQNRIRLAKLKETGAGGYYEYKVISLSDQGGLFRSGSGKVNTVSMTQTLNELGLEGWRLVTAYSNEQGKNAMASGASGMMFGTNSTIDENILIFERFVKIV